MSEHTAETMAINVSNRPRAGAPAWAVWRPDVVRDKDALHVVRWRLDLHDDAENGLKEFLSPEEWARIQRLVFPLDRRRRLAAWGIMREVLANLAGCSPRDLQFECGTHGKPRLVTEFPGNLHFNLSHSQGVAVLAFSWRGEVGVDVEEFRQLTDLDTLVRRFFAPEEVHQVVSTAMKYRPDVFFRIWTRKEAYLKADGTGITRRLDGFAVDGLKDVAPKLLRDDENPAWIHSRRLTHLEIAPRVVGALVDSTSDSRIHLYTHENWFRSSSLDFQEHY